MKKKIILIILLTFFVSILYADVIPAGHHIVSRSVSISNVDDYPEFTIVGYITGPMISGYKILEIKQDVRINKGYKFNQIKLYVVHNEVINSIGSGSIENIGNVYNLVTPTDIIDPGDFPIEDANPLVAETITYTIAGIVNKHLVMYISERRLEYNNGRAPTIEYYTYNP